MHSKIPKLQKKPSKTKQKRRKPKVSKEFIETEKEVAKLLVEKSLKDEGQPDAELLDDSLLFFTTGLPQASYVGDADADASSVEASGSGATATASRIDSAGGGRSGQLASSYIQIEDDELVRQCDKLSLRFDEDLLCEDDSAVVEVVANGQKGEELLYKSAESDKNFEPIFFVDNLHRSSPPPALAENFLTICLREVQFQKHPLQTEEHLLECRLLELLKAHREQIEHNLVKKLRLELQALREIVENYVREDRDENLSKLAETMRNVKSVREKLHREEAAHKSTLKDLLDAWIALKTLRKQEGFHFTSLKLILKVFEEEAEDFERRLQLELAEVYREELQEYYEQRKSKKLRKPKLENVAKRVRDGLEACVRLPGEPVVEVLEGRLESACKDIRKGKEYFLRVFFDEQLVGATMDLKMCGDFALRIEESFGVHLKQRMPRSIRISIYEKVKMSAAKVANILIPPPTDASCSLCIEFSSHKQPISGLLKLCLKCDRSEEVLDPTKSQLQLPKSVYKDWYRNQLLNPLEIEVDRNSIMKNDDSEHEDEQDDDQEAEDAGFFTFSEHSLAFCSQEEVASNPRFKMLSARHNQELKYKNQRPIPSFAHEIEAEDESESNVLDYGTWMDPIDLHKHKGKKRLRSTYEVIANYCEQMSSSVENASDLLIGNDPPSFSSVFAALTSLFTPHRPLHPPKSDPVVLPSSQTIEHFNVVVNVLRASGVPVRQFQSDVDERSYLAYANVRPYVNVRYESKSARTSTADGSSPTWNEEVVLKISGFPSEFKDDLKVQIFDEYIEDLLSDESARSMEVYQRIHANWLGEVRLPMSSLLRRHRVDGVFELQSPRVILGYGTPTLDQVETSIPIESLNLPAIRENVRLWMYVSVEPSVEVQRIRTDSLECSELKEVQNHIRAWTFEAKELQPSRFVDPLICTADGKRVCMTRLFEPIPLPIGIDDNLLLYCKRFVALLCVLRTTNPCAGLDGVWLNNETVLNTTWASSKDLAALLAGYFLNLGIKCWLALGRSLAHNETAFVLHQNELAEHFLTEPTTGRQYSVRDVHCPLTEIFAVVGQDNFYLNMQRESRVSMSSFNLSDAALWMPLFTKSNPAPVGGFQKLTYCCSESFSADDLRRNIERKVVKKVNSWRSTRKTVWNRGFQPVLLQTLRDLEKDLLRDVDLQQNYAARIQSEFPNYKIFGFPLNFPYRNLSSVSERVKSTGIHQNMDKNAEFGVAVHVHSYPNNVFSVGIFLVSAVPL